MKSITSRRFRNYMIGLFYLSMVLFTLSFTYSYAFTDWEEVAKDFNEGVDDMVDSVKCEIEYKEFYFEGLCTDKELIFDFLNNTVK